MKIGEIVKNNLHVDAFVDLLHYCFGVKREDIKDVIESRDDDTVVLGAIEKESLLASLIIHDFQIYWYGKKVKMGGIGGVSTFPEAREKNLVNNLLIVALRRMNENEQLFSLLIPFAYPFYKKYGWGWGITKKTLEIDINDLSHIKEQKLSLKPIDKSYIEQLSTVYEKYYSNYNGAIDRTSSIWEKHFDRTKENTLYRYGVFDQVQDLRGYLSYTMHNQIIDIEEMIYDSIDAKKQMYRFIYKHRANINKMKITVPENDDSLLLLINPRQNVTLNADMMVRVVNVLKVLERYPYKGDKDFSFTVKIEDAYAPWNNSSFEVKRKAKMVDVIANNEEETEICCSIDVFSQIIFGYISWEEAFITGSIHCSNKELIKAMDDYMIKHPTYMTEYF